MSIKETKKLPAGWRWAKLGDIARVFAGSAAPQGKEYYASQGEPFIRVSDLGKFKRTTNLCEVQDRLSEKSISECSLVRASKGTILFPKSGAAITNNNRALLGMDAYIVSHLMAVEPRNQTISEWIYWFLCQVDMLIFSDNDAYPSLKQSVVEKILVPLPPLPEQKRIAAILTEQMAAVEKARAAAEARLKAAKELPAAYLREVFESEEAKGWPRKRIEEIAVLLPSKSIASDGDKEVQAITSACLSETGFLPTGIKTARMKSSDAKQCIVAPGELLIARSNTPDLVGRIAMFEGEPAGVVASDLTIRILPHDRNNSEFLSFYLSFLYLSGYWKDRAGGASGTMKKITRGQILVEEVPVPPHEEQQRIILWLRDKTSGAQKMVQLLQDELKASKQLPAALLRQAFAGEL